jgi:3-oxoacyl-[acyl-carrier-protein] synthase II
MRKRVVVTGMGLISPVGLTVEETWQNILNGKSGVSKIEHFDASQFTTQFSACVKNFDANLYFSVKEARKFDVFIQYAVAAAHQAMKDSALVVDESNAHRIGVALGSGIGGLPSIEKTHQVLMQDGPRRISPFFIPGTIINMAPGAVSMQFGLKGPNISIVTACTTGTHNIGYAMRTIMYGDADVMVVGGAEMATSPLGVGGFAACRALSTRNDDPTKASRPWDKERDGFVVGDGAGVLILEDYEHAKKRGAKIYAELAGFGMSADAYHTTSPSPTGEGFVACMQNAVRDAAISFDQVDYINAHATSTLMGDKIESDAIQKTFGDHAKKLCISSTKSMTGHLLGAAGAVEAIFCVLALRDQIAPPTINLDNPEEGCNLDYVPHKARELSLNAVLSNSFGFGGTNGSLLFRKFDS